MPCSANAVGAQPYFYDEQALEICCAPTGFQVAHRQSLPNLWNRLLKCPILIYEDELSELFSVHYSWTCYTHQIKSQSGLIPFTV